MWSLLNGLDCRENAKQNKKNILTFGQCDRVAYIHMDTYYKWSAFIELTEVYSAL